MTTTEIAPPFGIASSSASLASAITFVDLSGKHIEATSYHVDVVVASPFSDDATDASDRARAGNAMPFYAKSIRAAGLATSE